MLRVIKQWMDLNEWDAIFLVNDGGKIEGCNLVAQKLCELSSSEILGKALHCFLPELKAAEKLTHKKKTYLETAGGVTVPVEVSGGNSFRKEKGKSFSVFLVHYLSKSHLDDKELKRLASFPEQNPNPIFEINLDGNLTYLNPAAKKFFPNLEREGLAHPILRRLPEKMNQMNKSGKESSVSEIRIGNTFYELDISFVPCEGLVRVYVSDITKRKELEELKSAFLSTVSHELRTPLTIIKGAVNNLTDGVVGNLTEKQSKVAKIAGKNVDRLSRIINDLLDLSRLESHQGLNRQNRITLHYYISEVMGGFQAEAKEKGIGLVTDLQEDLPDVYVDGDRLVQVLNNLLSNALRFAKKRIVIKAVVESEEGALEKENITERFHEKLTTFYVTGQLVTESYVRVSVIDDGQGIPKDKASHLFSKFVQLNRPVGGAGYKGTGLGLSICREIIEQHQGRIWVEDSEGQGACFHFTLPQYNVELDFWSSFKSRLFFAEKKGVSFSLLILSVLNLDCIKKHCKAQSVHSMMKTLQQKISTEGVRTTDKMFSFFVQDFIVILAETGQEGAQTMIRRLHELAKTCSIESSKGLVFPSIEVGYSVFPNHGTKPKQIFEKAMQDLAKKSKVSSQKRILIVDDEGDMIEVLIPLFTQEGFLVDVALDGQVGLEKAHTFKPDVILLDIVMPDMDGWEVCRKIRNDPETKDIPVVLLTGYHHQNLEERMREVKASHVIEKPFDSDELVGILKESIEGNESTQMNF